MEKKVRIVRLFMPSIISAFFFSIIGGIEALVWNRGHRRHRSIPTRSDSSDPRGVCTAAPRDVEASDRGPWLRQPRPGLMKRRPT
jgi:hypothetical protein